MITAYTIENLESDIEEGDMVMVSQSALDDAGFGDIEMGEDTDDEYEYERLGLVLDANTEDFNWENEAGDGSITVEVGDETVYTVGLSSGNAGAHVFTADDLEPVDRDDVLGDVGVETDPEKVDEEMSPCEPIPADVELGAEPAELAEIEDVPRVSGTDMGQPPWPDSWKESNKPARLIALDVWAKFGASFRGCRREMRKSMANPNRFCASFKDHIYMTTYWR